MKGVCKIIIMTECRGREVHSYALTNDGDT